MLCDKYKEALIEAAASGAALPGGLSEHVKACAFCAAKLAGEQTLFAAVDAGLRKAANAQTRSSFVPNLKANLATETVLTRKPVPGWTLVSATAAFALGVAFLSLPRSGHHEAQTEAVTVSSKVPVEPGEAGLSIAPERKTGFTAGAVKAREERDLSAAASHQPEVLIQPQENEFLKRFYVALSKPVRDAKAVVTDDSELMAKPLVIEQIEVRDLKIENLDEDSGLAQTGTK